MAKESKDKQVSLGDLHEQMTVANRLTILSLVHRGIRQSDIAASIGVSESVISRMFPKGLLKRVAARDQE